MVAGPPAKSSAFDPVAQVRHNRRTGVVPSVFGCNSRMSKPLHREALWDPAGEAIPFIIGHECVRELTRLLKRLAPDRVYIVTEARLSRRLGAVVSPAIPTSIPSRTLTIGSGEKAKTLATVEKLAARALADGATRRSLVISLGGGLVCNVAGMLAGGLFRGIRLVHVPTTLLAMHDTVTSLKQAVNIAGAKNLFGMYTRPTAIICDVQFCRSLSRNAMQAALVEIVKNGLVLGEPYVTIAKELCAMPMQPTPEFCLRVLESGIAAKRSLMKDDAFEKGPAIVFEYGHTVGHAIEATGTRLNHGQCIYWGMRAAGDLARQLGVMSQSAYRQHSELLDLLADVPLPQEKLDIRGLIKTLRHDNKRGHIESKVDHVPMVILKRIASPVRTRGLPLVNVPLESIEMAIATLPFAV